MIQDIKPQKLTNHYVKKEPAAGDRIMIFDKNMILVKNKDSESSFLTYDEYLTACEKQHQPAGEFIYLFTIESAYFLAVDVYDNVLCQIMEDKSYSLIKMFELRRVIPKENVFAGATAWHLYSWYRVNRFCGVCGCKMEHDEKERMLRCPSCNNMVFPRIVPAVIVGVINGDRMLMTKYAGREYKRYALIAGFTEIGETVEETVAREVMEEAGIPVKNIRYYKSQPWGFDSDLLLGYYCELDGDDDTIRMDEEELSVAEWVDFRDMPEYHEELSLTEEMMNHFKSERKKTLANT